ncbi:Domain found in IF2B/IF5 [seawater metagenome]|uniref:Domain found in IF2B/IF5 n=1 Tax=seawater metagenome TaxID=1561972 RepID=A0A5E8CKR6_9ZZZZ
MANQQEFELLINNLYEVLADNDSDNSTISKKIPNPMIKMFPRKIHWINFYPTTVALSRDFNHIKNYIISELGINISMKNSLDMRQGIILHTKCREKELKSLLGKYFLKYIQCKSCNSDNTTMEKLVGISKLYQIKCKKCFSTFNTT